MVNFSPSSLTLKTEYRITNLILATVGVVNGVVVMGVGGVGCCCVWGCAGVCVWIMGVFYIM